MSSNNWNYDKPSKQAFERIVTDLGFKSSKTTANQYGRWLRTQRPIVFNMLYEQFLIGNLPTLKQLTDLEKQGIL